jgi:hypothetical protein
MHRGAIRIALLISLRRRGAGRIVRQCKRQSRVSWA